MKEPKREDYINGTPALTPCVEYAKALEKYIAYLKDRPTITEDRCIECGTKLSTQIHCGSCVVKMSSGHF